jgi:phosphoserine phosphatase RsbU/P
MTPKKESSSFSRRLADFAARFDAGTGSGPKQHETKPGARRSAFHRDVRELFTKGVTREELSNLFQRDARDTLRFYAREVDFDSLQCLPWYKRHPAIAWKIFLALAHKLSPARRILFAIATLSFLLGGIQLIVFVTNATDVPFSSGMVWLFLAFAILVLLLLIELRDKLDLKGDLEIAREIQFGLVPPGPFNRNGTGIHCYMRPANTVGGDYYDIIELEDDRLAIVVGDVSGKGIPAALLMALMQGSVRTLLTAGYRGADVIAKLNVYLCSSIPENRLITLFYGELDTATGDLIYVNAGHNPPLWVHGAGNLEFLHATALVLGVDPAAGFEARATRLNPGERLLLYTDGVTEAFNVQEEEYGQERLSVFLQTHALVPPSELIPELVSDVLKFCGAARLTDDMTLMAITR